MDPITTGMSILDKVLGFIPNPESKQKAQLEAQTFLLKVSADQAMAQADINKSEAASSSIFVAGWRPAIGWVCAIGFAWTFVGLPLAIWTMAVTGTQVELPVIDSGSLMELTLGMLGLGALRTFEKVKGIKKK